MEKQILKSKIIIELNEKLQQGNKEDLQKFWEVVEKSGAPLIEKLEGDSENHLVTFVYKAEEDLENVVFIPLMPNVMQKLKENKLERLQKTNLWYISYEVRNDIRFSYFFSLNDALDNEWEKRMYESVNDKFNKNKILYPGSEGKEDKLASYVIMPKAEEHFWVKERRDISKGSLHEHEFYSEKLQRSRGVRIYTPYDYKENHKSYGFLVLTDGSDYIKRLSTVNVLDNLIADKKIPPIVTIFVDTNENRREDLKCSDTFGHMMVKELIPWVRENYNISNRADEAIIGGLSLGGLTASYLGLKHSEVFGNILTQSGSYWYKPEEFEGETSDCWLSTQFEAIDKLPLKFYMNVGVIENKENMIGTNLKLRDVLMAKGYTVDFEEFKSGHDYLSWGETLANGLISLFGMK